MLQTEFGLLKLGNQEVSQQKHPEFFSQWIDLSGAGFIVVLRGGGSGQFFFDWSLQESVVLKSTVCFGL